MTKVPGNLQVELAMLWRTLSLIEGVDGLSIVDFYEKYTPTVKAMPPLSLSAYWEEEARKSDNNLGIIRKSLVGIPNGDVSGSDESGESKRIENNLMNIPELDYLRHSDRIDFKHDPLSVVQNLYGAAASIVFSASPTNRSILLSACAALAVKSGRASLILHFISLLSSLIQDERGQSKNHHIASLDLDSFKDLLCYIESGSKGKRLSLLEPVVSTSSSNLLEIPTNPLVFGSSSRGDNANHNFGAAESPIECKRGMVLSCGKADHGKLGHGDVQIHRLVPTVVDTLQDVEIIKTASMSTYSVAIDSQGAVYVWGMGGFASSAQASKADIQPQLLEALPVNSRVTDVSCGLGHALFLLHNGRVFAWGNGGNGRLGLGDITDRTEACPIILLQHEVITAVQCGASHSMALTSNGQIYSWGKNTQGQCGHGNVEDHCKPTLIRKIEDKVIIQVAAGWEHSLALSEEGRMYSWGCGYKDSRRGVIPPVLGLGHNESRSSPELISSIESVRIVAITCGWDHCLALDEKGKVLSWGSGQNGKLGLGSEENVSIPCYIPTLSDEEQEQEGEEKGTAEAVAEAENAERGTMMKGNIKKKKKQIVVVHLAAGCEHTAVLTEEGDLYAWGHGDGGRLGHGNNSQCFVPTKVQSIEMMGIKPTSIHCGDKFTMILANGRDDRAELVMDRFDPIIQALKDSSPASLDRNVSDADIISLFSEVEDFIRGNLATSAVMPDTSAEKRPFDLNIHAYDESQVHRGMLLLMARACLSSAVPVSISSPEKQPFPLSTERSDFDIVKQFTLWARNFSCQAQNKCTKRSATTTVKTSGGLDREYSVECADSTFTNLNTLFELISRDYLDHLSRFIGTVNGSLTGALSAISLESSIEDFDKVGVEGGDSLMGANNNNNNNASFNSTGIMEDASIVDSIDPGKLIEHFEAIYCLLIVFAANIEVFGEKSSILRKLLLDKAQISAKDWRNIQREISRVVSINLHAELLSNEALHGTSAAPDCGADLPHEGGMEEEEENAREADADAEYSLGSVESEEHRLLERISRQRTYQEDYYDTHEAGEGRQQSHSHHNHHHHHQQDQQSDDEGHQDYRDEKSSFEGESNHDFGADSGDDSFFSGPRSRRRGETDSYDQYDDQGQLEMSYESRDDSFSQAPVPFQSNASAGTASTAATNAATAPAMVNSPSGLVPTSVSGPGPGISRGRGCSVPGSEANGSANSPLDFSRSSERDRNNRYDESGTIGSRGGSPALSFDSLTQSAGFDPENRCADDGSSVEREDENYHSDEYSSSQDSRFDHGARRPSGRSHRHRHEHGEEEDDGDMERYYEEQAQEIENLDLQRAIAASIQSNSSATPFQSSINLSAAVVFDGQLGRYGEGIGLSIPGTSPVIPRIRDQINSIASKCYLALDSLCGSMEASIGLPSSPPSIKSVSHKVGTAASDAGASMHTSKDNTAVNSLFLLWEASQIVTQIGFESLYTEDDQQTVIVELVRSPSSFMYIIPGIVEGADRCGRLETCLRAMMPSKEAFFTSASAEEQSMGNNAELSDMANALDLGCLQAFLIFCNTYIRDCRDVPISVSARNTAGAQSVIASTAAGSTTRRQQIAHTADALAVRMFTRVTTALNTLTKYLINMLFARISESRRFLNETIGFQAVQPLGPAVAKLFDHIIDCVQSDLEVITKKCSRFDRQRTGRFHNSFSENIVKFLFSQVVGSFDVIYASALLPHAIRLLRLFQSNYDAYKRYSHSRDLFNAWIVATLQYPIYHLSGSFSIILHPPLKLQPTSLRPMVHACKDLLNAVDVRHRRQNYIASISSTASGSRSSWCDVYAWEQHVWSAIGRSELNISSRTNSSLTECADVIEGPRNVDDGADLRILLLSACVIEDLPWMEAMKSSGVFPVHLPVLGAVQELQKCLTEMHVEQYMHKMKMGDVVSWSSLSTTTQLFITLLHLQCVALSVDLNQLSAELAKSISSSSEKPATAASKVMASNTQFLNFVGQFLQTAVMCCAIIEGIDASVEYESKLSTLKSVLLQGRDALFSGFKVASVNVFPPSSLAEVLRGSTSEEQAGHLCDSLLRIGLPLKQRLIAVIQNCAGKPIYLSQSTMLRGKSSCIVKPTGSSDQSAVDLIITFLFSPGLRMTQVARACLWEVDSLKNQQFALSLLALAVETLQISPAAVNACARFLQSFKDPLESLECIVYSLSHVTCDNGGFLSPSLGSSMMSVSHRTEQVLTKLDTQLTSKVANLPLLVSQSETETTMSALALCGKPSLKQVSDLLAFFRHSIVAQTQFSQSSLVGSILPMATTPFSASLKKISESISSLIAQRNPEDHSALTLKDVIITNQLLTILQSTLSGMISIHKLDSQQKNAAPLAGKKPAVDRGNDKSAFLNAISSVLAPLSSLSRALVACFQQHLLFCQAIGAQYLLPSVKAIEYSSPTILSNVFSPQGSFSLGFWLYLPSLDKIVSVKKEENRRAGSDLRRLHLMSRVYESGDMNLVTLLSSASEDNAAFSLSIFLLIDDGVNNSTETSTVRLEITVSATDFSSATREGLNNSMNARKKAVRKVVMLSKPLPVAEWVSCVVEVVQDSVALPREITGCASKLAGGAARAQARRDYKTKYVDSTSVALIVNNIRQCTSTFSGGRSALHQNMIIGKIPSKLGTHVGEMEQIILTDVFWVPSSVYLSATEPGYEKVREFLAAMESNELIFKASDSSDTDQQSGFYKNLLPQCPPSLLLEAIDSAFLCSTRILDLLTACLGPLASNVSVAAAGASVPKQDQSVSSVPLNIIPVICTFASELMCLGDVRTQDAAFKTLGAVMLALPTVPTAGAGDNSTNSGNSRSAMSPASPAGSAFNAAVQNKATIALRTALSHCYRLVDDILRSSKHHNVESDLDFLKQSPFQSGAADSRDIWLKRLKFGRAAIERCLRITEWGAKISVDENILLSGAASLLVAAVRKGALDSRTQQEFGQLANLICAGGWAPAAYVGSTAQLCPRRLFLHNDTRSIDQCAFPSTAIVVGISNNRPGMWLGHCEGSYQRIDRLPHCNPLLPRGLRNAMLSTEMVSVLDPFVPLGTNSVAAVLESISLKNADEIITILKKIVDVTDASGASSPIKTAKNNHGKSLLALFEGASHSSGTESKKDSDDSEATRAANTENNYLQMMQEMAFLRCLAVQLTRHAKDSENTDFQPDLHRLKSVILSNLPKILSIAVQDPIQAVSTIFSSGIFKGVQLDVLKNLLKEGDTSFLEKISLRLWKQNREDVHPSAETGFGASTAKSGVLQLSALQGEVIIADTKIRALSHFPSVKLQNVKLERQTGRWYYETTLLSDGLIQIGWANAFFRCDPVCGQGVGDHVHSWAYDGLRCKKWNVSCEAYGRRWRLGDTVGALVDLDLREMRFYLNGEDLGPAFEEFSGHELYPALSLNVRQCVRLNFGQYKFLHPPDELDGKPFKSVLQSLVDKPKSTPSFSVKNPVDATGGSTKSKAGSTTAIASIAKSAPLSEAIEDPNLTVVNTPVHIRSGSNDYDAASPLPYSPMSPVASNLISRNALSTPSGTGGAGAGAETPSTHMDTPIRDSNNTNAVASSTTLLSTVDEHHAIDQQGAHPPHHTISSGADCSTQNDDPDGQDNNDEDEYHNHNENHNEDEEELRRLVGAAYERDDDDDDDDDEGDIDAEDEMRERNREDDGDEDQEDDDEEEEVNNHLTELRRQTMIENLIGMGFPVEWALRAAENCDLSSSESSVITWIIERMEMEQTKMNELEADSSRVADDQLEEAEVDELDSFINRHTGAFRLQRAGSNNSAMSNGPAGNGPNSSSMNLTGMHSQRLAAIQRGSNPGDGGANAGATAGTFSGAGAGLSGGLGSGSGVSPGGSPLREEIFGLRHAMGSDEDAMLRNGNASSKQSGTSGKNNAGGHRPSGLSSSGTIETQICDDLASSSPWNADFTSTPLLPGHYVAKRRHDLDKQEVLSQVVELEQVDMLPIILACEFSLCVYYARTIILRSVGFLERETMNRRDQMMNSFCEFSPVAGGSTSLALVSTDTTGLSANDGNSIANDSIGMSVLSSLLQGEGAAPSALCELFKISFKQHVVALVQPDRLFPLIANGNSVGDARDRVPPFAPFMSNNMLTLNHMLSRLELKLFDGSEGSLSVDETSIQGLRSLSQVLDVAIYHSALLNPQPPISLNPSSISSNLSELQTQLLKNMGVHLDTQPVCGKSKLGMGCRELLLHMVRDSLDILQAASAAKYNGNDWISLSLDRHEKTADQANKTDPTSILISNGENLPPVAFAYWFLRNLLVKSEHYGRDTGDGGSVNKNDQIDSPTMDKTANHKNSPLHASATAATTSLTTSALELLTSSDTLSKLLKLSTTQNLSMRFCIYDLCALILSSVNAILNKTRKAEDRYIESSSRSCASPASPPPPPPQISAAEYYITIAKEKRLLQIFGARMKAECADRRLFTRFTRAVGGFLFQWHLLRRQLGLSSLNYMHEYLMSDLSMQKPSSSVFPAEPSSCVSHESLGMSPQTNQRAVSEKNERSSDQTEKAKSWSGLRVRQLTSSGVTVDWSLDEEVFSPCNADIVDKLKASVSSASKDKNREGEGETSVPALEYNANLYFTAASHMGLETPVLVLANMERSGTFHIDDLEADTLYKITISKENLLNNESSDQEEDREINKSTEKTGHTREEPRRKLSSTLLSFFDNGAAISTPHREILAASPYKDSPTVHQDTTAGASTVNSPLMMNSLEQNTLQLVAPSSDLMQQQPQPNSSVAVSGKPLPTFPEMPELSKQADGSANRLQALQQLLPTTGASDESMNGDNGALVLQEDSDAASKSEVVLFISTECEAPFQFESDQLSPNISVGPLPLMLHNTANKKWSTARASVRLVSGIHRWDVHIDRCISKNIFLGVANKDARLDNYVGCDKNGWAFLANKAVWHNKAKVKAYGELFRTGDTVTVELDLDQGTLSYSLNGKSLGVALEGLTGPVYPAFSLYNEDDQITIIQVRTGGSSDSPGGGAGSCAAEKVLERVETLSAMMKSVQELFEREQMHRLCASNELAVVLSESANESEAVREVHTITEELGAELLQRWELWKVEIPIRSFLVENDFVVICGSPGAVSVLSKDRLQLWENVRIASERAVVVGVGQHKLWVRGYGTGELVCYSSEALDIMLAKGGMISIEAELHKHEDSSELPSCVNELVPILRSPTGENMDHSLFFTFEISAVAMKEALWKLQAKWQFEDDIVLLNFLTTTARFHGANVFNLNVQHIIKPSPSSTVLERLWIKYSEEDVALRALFLIHMNDLILPLLPVICPYSNAAEEIPFFANNVHQTPDICSEAAPNHPTASLKTLRTLLLPQVKREFAERLAVSVAGSQLTLVRPSLSRNQKSSVTNASATGNTTSRDDGLEARVDSGKLNGRAFQSILSTLDADSKRYLDAPDSSPPEKARLGGAITGGVSPSPQYSGADSPAPLQLLSVVPTKPLQHVSTAPTASANTIASTAHELFVGVAGGMAQHNIDQDNVNTKSSNMGLYGIVSSSTCYLDTEQCLVLELSEEAQLSSYIYDMACEKGVVAPIQQDSRWKLVCGIQASYVGQMMSFFEQVANLNTNSTVSDGKSRFNRFSKNALSADSLMQLSGDASGWEDYLRNTADGLGLLWSNDDAAPRQKSVPFIIRATQWAPNTRNNVNEKDEDTSIPPSRLFQLLALAEGNAGCVSEWSLFAAFVDEACAQVFRVVLSFYNDQKNNSDGQNNCFSLSEWGENTAYLSLLLQLFHSIGVVIGLALRHGVPVHFPLPKEFYPTLSNTPLSFTAPYRNENTLQNVKERRNYCNTTVTLALALRTGIIAVFPEPAFDLLSGSELEDLFNGRMGCGPPAALMLQRTSTYQHPIARSDQHIQMFWAAVCELAPYQVRCLIRALLPEEMEDTMRDQLLFGDMCAGARPIVSGDTHITSAMISFHIHILPPTAVALLSPDTSYMTLFPESGSIAIPRYSSFRVMMQQLLRVIEA